MKIKILYYTGKWLTKIISKLVFRIRTSGQENIPASGGFILAPNHTSYFDPPLAGSWIKRQVYFLAKAELFKNRLFGGIISRTNALPIRRGVVDRNALKLATGVLDAGYGLTIFPEGTRSKTDQFLEPKAGIGMIALKAKVPIVPCYIHGSNRLKAVFWGRERMSITYGEAIPASAYADQPESKEGYLAVASLAMREIGALKQRVLG